ncbi:MAG TPA: hypothetical protein VLO11_01010 [Luteolibacter sp.]|nr:hypothetical protein [Luteolibacter sp.]
MSENENQPPAPSKQTSSVPLKKETVRVTLKAADAPKVPTSSVPLAPPVRPPVPGGAPKPPTPTVPLKAPAAATKPAQPTIKLATSTTPLKATTPGALPGATPTLPKATVQLQPPTAPIGAVSPSQAATLRVEDDEEDVEPHEGLLKILSGVGFAAALLLLVVQISLAGVWINAEDNSRKGDWSQIIE